MTTTTGIDFALLRRAIEERDAVAQLGFYAADAEVRIVDRDHTPRSPQVLRGTDEIRGWIEDVANRDLTHHVTGEVVGADRASYLTECTYPDGTQVLCAATAEVSNGLITRLTGVQVWDD